MYVASVKSDRLKYKRMSYNYISPVRLVFRLPMKS
jgi:hypothetical protein